MEGWYTETRKSLGYWLHTPGLSIETGDYSFVQYELNSRTASRYLKLNETSVCFQALA